MATAEQYMRRCIHLAELASGYTAPNPMVGAVLVYNDRIIGEGYHQQYGGPHAEVNCIASVPAADRHLISQSTLYVSLEPCAHHGKTPPCADLIIANKIPKVVVGCLDPFVAVDGKGADKLRKAGIETEIGLLKDECMWSNRRFLHFHTKHRPYIILKWAETADRKISSGEDKRLMISNSVTNRLVHKWRTEEAAILVGTNTALKDNPQLNARFWNGPDPVRLVIDKDLQMPATANLMDGAVRTIIFNLHQHAEDANPAYYQITNDVSTVHQVVHALYHMKILSVIVEGGARLLQSFIDEDMWDEARVITNEDLFAGNGLASPSLSYHRLLKKEQILTDVVRYFIHE